MAKIVDFSLSNTKKYTLVVQNSLNQVSWLKRIGEDKDPHLLTYGRQTYSSDARFQVIQSIICHKHRYDVHLMSTNLDLNLVVPKFNVLSHLPVLSFATILIWVLGYVGFNDIHYADPMFTMIPTIQIIHEKPNNWKLQIQFTKRSDEGLYECQVSTNPPLIQYTYIRVVGEYTSCLSSGFVFFFKCPTLNTIIIIINPFLHRLHRSHQHSQHFRTIHCQLNQMSLHSHQSCPVPSNVPFTNIYNCSGRKTLTCRGWISIVTW